MHNFEEGKYGLDRCKTSTTHLQSIFYKITSSPKAYLLFLLEI